MFRQSTRHDERLPLVTPLLCSTCVHERKIDLACSWCPATPIWYLLHTAHHVTLCASILSLLMLCCRFVCNYIYHKSLQLTESLHQSQLSAQDAAADPATRQQANSSGSSSSYCTEGLGNAAAGGGASACSSDNGNTSSSNSSTTDGIAAAATADACQGKQVYSLFVHVPPFASISEEKQREFLLVLLQAISRWLSTGDQQVGASLPVTSS